MKKYLVFLIFLILLIPFRVMAAFNIKDPSTYPSYQRQLNFTGGNALYGEDVKFIQTAFKDFGYSIDIDGYYGPLTKSIALKFQTDAGMDGPNGIFGPLSWNKMMEMLKAKYPVRAKSISVLSFPNKDEYEVGQTLYLNGLSLEISYSDGSKKTITSGYTKGNINMNTPGTKNLSISYEGVSTSITIIVKDKPVIVQSIGIFSLPKKLSYNIGEKIDTSGLVLVINYSNNTSENISNGFSVNGNTNSVGKNTITVSYSSFKVTYTINVIDKNLKLESIEIKEMPKKVKFTVDEKFTYDGLEIKCIYTDGSSKIIDKGFSVTANTSEKGLKKATVKYQGLEVKYGITIESKKSGPKEEIIIEKMPDKVTYYDDEEISFDGLVVKYIDKEGKEKEITDYKIEDYTKDYGTNTITISYKELNTTFDISIKDSNFESLDILFLNKNKYYSYNDTLDNKDINLIIKYKDGSKKLVKDDIEFEYDFTNGNSKVNASYNGETISFEVKLTNTIIKVLMNNLYLIIGATGAVLLVTISVIIIIIKRRKRHE